MPCRFLRALGLALLPLTLLAQQAPEEGSFLLHKFKQPIGEERWRAFTDGPNRILTSEFSFKDRFTPVKLSAYLRTVGDFEPQHFELKGQTSRQSSADLTIHVDGGEAEIRDGAARSKASASQAFTVAGTDQAVPGHSIHREMELYVKAGFTPMEAIQAATSLPAKVMGQEKESGTVAPGLRADLVVVDGDPLAHIEDMRRIHLVIAQGRRFEPGPLWESVGFKR